MIEEGNGLFDQLIYGLTDGITQVDQADYSHYEGNMLGFIKEVLQEPTWHKLDEIVVSVEQNTYTAVQSANSIGKTWIAARIVLAWLNIYRESCKIVTTAAPPERQIKELLWGEIKDAWRKADNKGVPMVGKPPGAMNIRVSPNWWAQGFTIPITGTREERITRFQGHHAEHLLFILDEAYGIPPEIYEAMDSCLSGGHNHALLLSNPMAPSGPFYETVKDPNYNVIQLSAFDHPNVVTGKVVIPGATTREKTVKRIKEWSRPMGEEESYDASCFTVPDFIGFGIGGQQRKVTFPFLDTKTLGRFPSQAEGSLCSIASIQAAADRWVEKPPEDIESVASADLLGGLDVAEMGVDSNAWILRKGSWVSKVERWGGVDLMQTGGKATQKAKAAGTVMVYVDGNGLGAGVAPHIKSNGVDAIGIKTQESPTVKLKEADGELSGEFNKLRDQLLWAVREWLRTDENAMLPPDPNLLQELSVLTYETNIRGKIVVMSKENIKQLISRSPDALDAFMLTFFKGKQYGTLGFVKV